MSSLIFKRSSNRFSHINFSKFQFFFSSNQNHKVLVSGVPPVLIKTIKNPFCSYFSVSKYHNFAHLSGKDKVLASGFGVWKSLFSTQAAAELSTSDGITVDGIAASNWTILDESESDWKSHAAAIAQSIQVIKRRLQV